MSGRVDMTFTNTIYTKLSTFPSRKIPRRLIQIQISSSLGLTR